MIKSDMHLNVKLNNKYTKTGTKNTLILLDKCIMYYYFFKLKITFLRNLLCYYCCFVNCIYIAKKIKGTLIQHNVTPSMSY